MAAFAYENRITGVAQPELCVIGWSPTTSGMKTCSIYDAFSVEAIDFDNAPDDTCLATLQFRTPDDEKLALGLKVHSLYETEIPLKTLIEGQVSMTDEFKKGTFLRSAAVKPRDWGPNSSWPYKFEEIDGNATLDTDKLTVVFEGEEYRNRGTGSLHISGSSGPLRGISGELDHQYSNGVCKVKFRTHVFRLFDGGNLLSRQETDVDLSQKKKVVTVKKDGSIIAKDK